MQASALFKSMTDQRMAEQAELHPLRPDDALPAFDEQSQKLISEAQQNRDAANNILEEKAKTAQTYEPKESAPAGLPWLLAAPPPIDSRGLT